MKVYVITRVILDTRGAESKRVKAVCLNKNTVNVWLREAAERNALFKDFHYEIQAFQVLEE